MCAHEFLLRCLQDEGGGGGGGRVGILQISSFDNVKVTSVP